MEPDEPMDDDAPDPEPSTYRERILNVEHPNPRVAQLQEMIKRRQPVIKSLKERIERFPDEDELRTFLRLQEERQEEHFRELETIIPPEEGEQEGGALLRNPRENPPNVRKLLEKIGQENVDTIKLVRTPLNSVTKTLLNIASFGQLDKVMKQIGTDKFFHLSMLINGKYVYEKNAVINMTTDPNIVKSNSETLDVPVDRVITIAELVKNTQLQMADNYGPYDAKNNNCSIFINAVLKANALSNQNTDAFLSQKSEELFDAFPSLTKKIVDFATTTGAVVDRTLQGEGHCMCGGAVNRTPSSFGSQSPAPSARAIF